MRIAVLTSSRADYGIYKPLLDAIHNDPVLDLRLIVFGTHLSRFHGHTIDQIKEDGFVIDHTVANILGSDSAEAIATSMAITFTKFTSIWSSEKTNYDLVFCLGDRYEMFAAVSAGSAFRIKFAHLHGGETTLGAIDNEYRHAITIFSILHFTATQTYAERVAAIIGSDKNIYNVGSLSLQNLGSIKLLEVAAFQEKFGIDLSLPSILLTYHPETVSSQTNVQNTLGLLDAMKELGGYQLIITMPNADTMGNSMREEYKKFESEHPQVKLVENFGTLGYFSCMNLCKLVVGNSSSGIIEAASFHKYVINVGNRQEGRLASGNVIHCSNNKLPIVEACKQALAQGEYTGENIYYKNDVANEIVRQIKLWKQ